MVITLNTLNIECNVKGDNYVVLLYFFIIAGLAIQIAQSLDFKTTIELARIPGVDLALFLKPPQPLKAADASKVLS